jgi:hypothetical protein
MLSVLETVLAYHAAGLGLLPVRPDGSKAPALRRGHPYPRRRPQNWAGVRPERGKRAMRSSQTSQVAAREQTVRSDMEKPPGD